jgi:hypothetical protein
MNPSMHAYVSFSRKLLKHMHPRAYKGDPEAEEMLRETLAEASLTLENTPVFGHVLRRLEQLLEMDMNAVLVDKSQIEGLPDHVHRAKVVSALMALCVGTPPQFEAIAKRSGFKKARECVYVVCCTCANVSCYEGLLWNSLIRREAENALADSSVIANLPSVVCMQTMCMGTNCEIQAASSYQRWGPFLCVCKQDAVLQWHLTLQAQLRDLFVCGYWGERV